MENISEKLRASYVNLCVTNNIHSLQWIFNYTELHREDTKQHGE
jgi:hypothetical protein